MTTRSRLFRLILWIVFGIVAFAAYALSWKVTEPDFVKLIVASPKAKQILPQLMTPDLVAREAITSTLSLAFPDPLRECRARRP